MSQDFQTVLYNKIIYIHRRSNITAAYVTVCDYTLLHAITCTRTFKLVHAYTLKPQDLCSEDITSLHQIPYCITCETDNQRERERERQDAASLFSLVCIKFLRQPTLN